MPAFTKAIGSSGQSRTGMRRLAPRHTASSACGFCAADLMPTGSGFVLPQLTGVQPELQWVSDDRPLAMLAKTLLLLRIADPLDWVACGKNPSRYVVTTTRRWIQKHGAKQIGRRFDLHLTIADTVLAYPDRDARPGKMFLIVDPESAGYVLLWPAIELLEGVHAKLPATLFHCLLGSINEWMRTYDCRDAEEHVEVLQEWARSDGDPDGYELPDVEGCKPKSLKEGSLVAAQIRKALSATDDLQVRNVLAAMLGLNRVARRYKRPKMTHEIQEALSDCNPPLPSVLAVFSEHDAVEGCFDEESQTAYEMEPQPNLIIPIDVASVVSVRSAFESLRGFCRTMAAVVALIDAMPGNENFVFQDTNHECSPEDRDQSNLSAETCNFAL